MVTIHKSFTCQAITRLLGYKAKTKTVKLSSSNLKGLPMKMLMGNNSHNNNNKYVSERLFL